MELDNGREEGEPAVPAESTQAEPGSAEKIAVMRRRFERGEQLFHDKDRRDEHAYNQPKRYYGEAVSLKYWRDSLSQHLRRHTDDENETGIEID